MKHNYEIKPCPECNGTGSITVNYRDNDYKVKSRAKKCLDCNGTGILRKKIKDIK
jgi:DnaJ-class molecular chaperone